MKTRNVVTVLLVLLAIAGAAYFYASGRIIAYDSAASDTAKTLITADSLHTNDDNQRVVESKQAAPPETSRPLTLRDRYVRSTNLFELAEQLRADADTGNVEATRIIAAIYEECGAIEATRGRVEEHGPAQDKFNDEEKSIFLAHRAEAQQRCAGFIVSGPIMLSESNAMEMTAAELNDPIAQARQLANTVGLRRQDEDGNRELSGPEIELSQRIAASGDAEAIAALASSQDDQHLGKRAGQAVSSLSTNKLAWELAACDLGRDCGANGYVMRDLCLSHGKCISGNYRDYVRRRMVPSDQYEAVLAREREILQAIKSGDVSHLFP